MDYEFKGTPKEWHAVEFAGFWSIKDEPFYDAKDVLMYDEEVFGCCVHEPQAKANAYLCAAAPELLAACIEAYEDYVKSELPFATSEKLRKAIEKALNINQ